MAVRQVVLDTETTGIDWKQGHRVIEIGAVELIDRRVTEA
ncbi:exonuclease domain-containing protein, partial [Acidithiobacillus ferrooxidans]